MKQDDKLFSIFVRYFFIIVLGVGNLFVFYKIFSPLTIYGLGFVLGFFRNVDIIGNIVYFGLDSIEIIPSCVAGAAYYFLFSLVMACRMEIKTRFKAIGALIGSFFLFNMIRLIVLSFLIGGASFEVVHWISWHLMSTLVVVALWIFAIKIFKIEAIPVWDDFKYLFSLSSFKKDLEKTRSSGARKSVSSKLRAKAPSSSGKKSKGKKKHKKSR